MNGFDMVQLIDSDAPWSFADILWLAKALIEVESRGPSLAADLQSAIAAAAKAAWWGERQMSHEQIERINELADKLVTATDCDRALCQVAAKQVLHGTRKKAVVNAVKQYLELGKSEAEQRQPKSEPITITSAADVPAAVRLAQKRRHGK